MGKSIRVFISSTWGDLKPEREAVEKALHRMQDTAFASMEYFGSRPETPKDVSLAEVDRSDVYIGIFAHRYGSGITEAEYRRARQRNIPCLIYFKDDSVPVVPARMERDDEKVAKLESLKRELKQRHTVSFFHGPDHLATQVVADLHNHLGTAPTAREEPPQSGPKYQVNIREGRGIIIGDHAQVTQSFGGSEDSSRSSSGSTPWLVQVRGEHRVYLIDQERLRHWVLEGETLKSIGRWENIEPLATWDELAKFPPGRPLPSIVHGVKPWLVKVKGETEIYFIGEDDVRHRIVNPDVIAALNQRTEVDVFVSWKELERFLPAQPLSGIPSMSLVTSSTPSATQVSADFTTLRIQHLADNIRQDMELLKDYEDALRYEDDPRRRARYRREIEQLRESAARYQQEYNELRAQVIGEPSLAMQDVAAQLQQMDTKLDALLKGQTAIRDDLSELRHALLARFDTTERAIITTFVERLDQNQVATVEAVLGAIQADRVSESQLEETLVTVEEALSEIQRQGTGVLAPALAGEVEQLAEVVKASELDVKHKLKVTVPIIPLVLSYEGEVELGTGMNLEMAWRRLIAKVRGG